MMPYDTNPDDFWGDAVTVAVPDSPQSAGNVTPVAVGKFTDVLQSVSASVTSVARSIADLQVMRDNLANNQAQLELRKYSNTAQLQLQRDKIAGDVALNRLGLQAQIAKAQAAISGQGGNLMLILTVVGIGVAIFALVKK